MKLLKVLTILLIVSNSIFAQEIILNRPSDSISLESSKTLTIQLKQDEIYRFYFDEPTLGLDISLMKDGKQLKKYALFPNDGAFLLFDFKAAESGNYQVHFDRYKHPENPLKGKFTYLISQYSPNERIEKVKIEKELEAENKKNVQTLDIDHFYQAFDHLKNCKTHQDSLESFQHLYLDRATDGLKDFINVRYFTAEKFVKLARKYPKFYNSVRKNVYQTKEAAPAVTKIIDNFAKLYKNYHRVKICFAVGLINTGGTVSDDFMLIGSEITTSNKEVDLSEFPANSWEKNVLTDTTKNISPKISAMIAHEYIHTQQNKMDKDSVISCPLLSHAFIEGMCDFIGEKLSDGNQINSAKHLYGNAHEGELWKLFKNELCNEKQENWFGNKSNIKGRPVDLGYYIGYKIVEEYYKNASDKQQAITDILEMNDPMMFLAKSKYDQKVKL